MLIILKANDCSQLWCVELFLLKITYFLKQTLFKKSMTIRLNYQNVPYRFPVSRYFLKIALVPTVFFSSKYQYHGTFTRCRAHLSSSAMGNEFSQEIKGLGTRLAVGKEAKQGDR